jgi:hypothetical protein
MKAGNILTEWLESLSKKKKYIHFGVIFNDEFTQSELFLPFTLLAICVSKYLCREHILIAVVDDVSNHVYVRNSALGQQASNNKGANI